LHLLVSVNWTNWSVLPPSYAFCSAAYPWFWSQVSACDGLNRVGLNMFGFWVSSFGVSPLISGVLSFAVNGVPSAFVAFGYVPK